MAFPCFLHCEDMNSSAHENNDDLKRIEVWVLPWEMNFNTNLLKQAQEVLSSRKRNKLYHPNVIFNVNPVKKSSYQKHLRMFLIVTLILMKIS